MRQGFEVLSPKLNTHNEENGKVFEVSSQPVLDDSAYYGFPGDFVKALDPHTEADPAGILLQFLVAFGNAVGDGPYFPVEGDRHPPRENVLLVGDSSKGRKGTSWGRIRQLYRLDRSGTAPIHVRDDDNGTLRYVLLEDLIAYLFPGSGLSAPVIQEIPRKKRGRPRKPLQSGGRK